MIFVNNISINLFSIAILTAVLFIYILAIYLYNIYVYINTILLLYNNEIKLLFHFIIFISLVVFNNIGLFILEDKNEILLNFLAEINKDNNMSNVDYMKGSSISEVTSGSRGRIPDWIKTVEPTPYKLSSDRNNNVYRLNGGELLNDLACRGKFERVQGTRDINFADFEGTTAIIKNGLKHDHETYIVMVNESDRNGFSLVARNVLFNEDPSSMSVGEKLFNNVEYIILPKGSMYIPPRVDGSFNLQLKDKNGNILSVDCYI